MIFTIFIHERRLEQTAVAREAALLTERQEKDATSKALAEAQGRIEGLLKEIYSANRKTDQLQNTIERSVVFITGKSLTYAVFTSICKYPVAWGLITDIECSCSLVIFLTLNCDSVVSGRAKFGVDAVAAISPLPQ